MRMVIEAFIAAPDEAREIVASSGADYLWLCPDGEPEQYAVQHPEGLAASLTKGRYPAWLERIEVPSESGIMLFRIRKET